MWTLRRRKKLEKQAKKYDAVIVLGCDSATETVRDVVSAEVRVIEGMKIAGIMNGRMSFRLPGDLFFDGCKVVPISQ
jgi:hypothetical protein